MSEPTAGHNSGPVAADRLKSFVERIERIESERNALGADIKDIYTEVKSAGFDTKIVRQIVRLRREDESKRKEREELMALYMNALGMLSDTPLGQAALRRVGG